MAQKLFYERLNFEIFLLNLALHLFENKQFVLKIMKF